MPPYVCSMPLYMVVALNAPLYFRNAHKGAFSPTLTMGQLTSSVPPTLPGEPVSDQRHHSHSTEKPRICGQEIVSLNIAMQETTPLWLSL